MIGRPRKLPAMKNDLAARIKHLRQRLNLSQQQLAEQVGVSQPTVSRWEKAEDVPEAHHLRRLAKLAGMSIAKFQYGQDPINGEILTVPVIGIIGLGEEVTFAPEAAGNAAGLEQVEVPPQVAAAGLVALRIRGNAMRPLRDGWILYYNPTDNVGEDCIGELCVAETITGQCLVKELRRGSRPGRFTLLSWNANVDPLEDQVLRWAAPVVAIRRP